VLFIELYLDIDLFQRHDVRILHETRQEIQARATPTQNERRGYRVLYNATVHIGFSEDRYPCYRLIVARPVACCGTALQILAYIH